MPQVQPTPLPQVARSRIQDPAVKETLENVLIYLQRTRRVLFDSSEEESLGAQITGLQNRPKDVYTFPIGTPSVTPEDPGYAITPLEAVATGTVLEVRIRGQKPAKGTVGLRVLVDGSQLATLGVGAGQVRATTTPESATVEKDALISVVVFEAPDDPGLDDAVVQVLVA